MNGKYPAVWLDNRNQHIHRLVWIENHGFIPDGFIIHHKDENKLNWDISNLELLNRSEHIKEHKNIVHRHGVKIIASKENTIFEFNSIEDAANFCGTYPSGIHRILIGKQKKANGWFFERLGD